MLRHSSNISAAVFAAAGLFAPAATPAFSAPDAPERTRLVIPFDADWRFLRDNTADMEKSGLDDSAWRPLNVPHDWSIEGSFSEKNTTGGAGAFLPAGVGWYRKHFALPPEDAGRRVFVEFDGVMANSDVWINEFHLGKRPYGYVSFRYELTDHLKFDGQTSNVLAVRADNSAEPASRWYAGAGVNRHVRLIVTNPVHIDAGSTFVTTPQIEENQATVHLQTSVINQSGSPQSVSVRFTLIDPEGNPAGETETGPQTISEGKSADFQQEIPVKNPKLWNLDHPFLYHAAGKVLADKTGLDEETTVFGIREFHFDAATGFSLNGKNMKLKGVCLHQDAGGLGTAVPLRAWERRLDLLKQTGCNAIRTSHNPVAPEFLDLCDRMGFLVMDEMFDCWMVGKNPADYHLFFDEWSQIDTRDTVRRDRNHPSIILYSAGNEIHDTRNAEQAKKILTSLRDVFHANDPTRPVTQALFRPNQSGDYTDGLADLLDVVGQNYREREILAAHNAKPERKIIGTENGHDRAVWVALRDNAYYAGQFLWTGFDYLGESRRWPVIGADFGLFDRTGASKPRAFQRQSWWSERPMVYMTRRTAPDRGDPTDPGYEPSNERNPQTLFPDWTPRNTSPHDETVEVYSNCEQVELTLNGESLGSKPRPEDDSARIWKVSFASGTLKAVGSNQGSPVATHELRTAGKAAAIALTTDRNTLAQDWDDVAYITASVVDENGVTVPNAANSITFSVNGPGAIAAVDSGDNASQEPFQVSERKAWQGQCIAILKATAPSGKITMTASAENLASASLTIDAAPSAAKK